MRKKKIFEFHTIAPFTKFNELRKILKENLQNYRISEDKIHDCITVVDEIFSNIVEHSYKFKKGPVKLKIEKDDKNIIICFEDQGKPFIFKKGREISFDEKQVSKKERGLGLFIVQKITSKFDFERKGRRNIKKFHIKLD